MHGEAKNFTLYAKNVFPSFFINKKVLDVGSGDINGNNRFLFENCDYSGNDLIEAPNVTIVSKTMDLPFDPETFDTIISTECFEHDPTYKESFQKIVEILKPGGLFVFTCASTGRPEHGTLRSCKNASYGTIGNIEGWSDYYKNLTVEDVNESIDLDEIFESWKSYYNCVSKDLYFVGVKKGGEYKPIPVYSGYGIMETTLIQKSSDDVNINDIFDKYNTDKNSQFHNYTRQYQGIFQKYRNKPIKFLEIGVFKGESIKGWKEYFHKDSEIVGVDIQPQVDNLPGIDIVICDSNDKTKLEMLFEKYGGFDVILDDGSHKNSDVINSFEHLFPLLNDGGLYVVEDTICFKSNNYIDKNYPNHLEYFYQYIPYLNQWRYDSETGVKDNCVDPFKIQKKSDNIFECSIDKIEFGCSFIAIHKLLRSHWLK